MRFEIDTEADAAVILADLNVQLAVLDGKRDTLILNINSYQRRIAEVREGKEPKLSGINWDYASNLTVVKG